MRRNDQEEKKRKNAELYVFVSIACLFFDDLPCHVVVHKEYEKAYCASTTYFEF